MTASTFDPSSIDSAPAQTRAASWSRETYLALLTWAFALFSSVRMLAYLPMLWAIVQTGDSSQHSLWTWGTWIGAHATMALWLYEKNGQRTDRAMMVSVGNLAMSVVTAAVIAWHRF